MNKKAEREAYQLEKYFEHRESYSWHQSMKRGCLLEGTFGHLLVAYVFHDSHGFYWEMKGNPMWVVPCDESKYHETLDTLKQDALEYAIAYLHQAHRNLVQETGLDVRLGTAIVPSCRV